MAMHNISSASPAARIRGGKQSSDRRVWASATGGLPAWASAFSKTIIGDLSEGSDAANVAYTIPIRRDAAPAIALHFAVGLNGGAENKHAKWRIYGLRQRRGVITPDLLIHDLVPLIEVGVFGGPIDVDTSDPIIPANGAPATSLKWCDTIEITTGEQYVADDAIQLIQVAGGVAELQLHTQGCPWIVLAPACIASASPGSDAASHTAAAHWDI